MSNKFVFYYDNTFPPILPLWIGNKKVKFIKDGIKKCGGHNCLRCSVHCEKDVTKAVFEHLLELQEKNYLFGLKRGA
jgi:hypothetical protein